MKNQFKALRYLPLVLALGMGAAAQASLVSVSDTSSDGYSNRSETVRSFNLAAAARGAALQIQRTIAMDKATPTGLVLSSGGEASLWNFIACIHAQQRDRAFEHLESDLRHIDHLPKPVSTVPLPGSAWLLLIGLMGVVGSRVMPRVANGNARADAGRPARRDRAHWLGWPIGGTGRTAAASTARFGLGLRAQAA